MDTYYSLQIAAYRKIAEARRVAAQDRLALTATRAGREAQPCERAPLAKVLSVLAGTFGLRHPTLLKG